MHEIGMCEGVLAAVEQRAAGRPVSGVGVRVGALLRVVPDAFQQAFELVAAGSVADGAVTRLTIVPVEARCPACSTEFATDDPAPACPRCASVDLERRGGDELVLEWLEYHGAAAPGPIDRPARS